MKVLIDHPAPFALAHGGLQTQIEQTKAGLERLGLEVEFLRWWDDRQAGDVIHYFGRPNASYIGFAHAKNIKVVIAELLTGLGSRPAPARFVQKCLISVSRAILPGSFTARMAWDAYEKADAIVALTTWEAHLMKTIFRADPRKIRVIANGVEDVFFTSKADAKKPRADYLVCTATIHPRKRVLELAEAATRARVPLWVIGKPYAASDPYCLRFMELQKKHSKFIRYQGAIYDRAELACIYKEARGFALLSSMESLSLSALEAAAAECPVLLSDLPWARSSFGAHAHYASVDLNPDQLAKVLQEFSREAPSVTPSFRPKTWDEIARELIDVYKSC